MSEQPDLASKYWKTILKLAAIFWAAEAGFLALAFLWPDLISK